MPDILFLDELTPANAGIVGGKAIGLATMLRTGLPVPPGFCLTTQAYFRYQGKPLAEQGELARQLVAARHNLEDGLVAVRSAAIGEDEANSSFAGQHETFLNVTSEEAMLDAVNQCWASLHSTGAAAYRRRMGIGEPKEGMGVIIQRMVPAEVAGILFTRDPFDGVGGRILVEAAVGLGDRVVSGRVTPDRYYLDRATGTLIRRELPANDSKPCLNETQLAQLANLGSLVEALWNDARDVEWAWADDQFWLLQARPIAGADSPSGLEIIRREEIAQLAARVRPGGTIWTRNNLAEVLPEPTPMTWAVVQHLVSGQGGLGLMYTDLGFSPDPALDDRGFYDLICGRPYVNLSLEPGMYCQGLPFHHDIAALKANPSLARFPKAQLAVSQFSWRQWAKIPGYLWRSGIVLRRLHQLDQSFARHFTQVVIPAFAQEARKAAEQDFSQLDSSELSRQFHYWVCRTLRDFARDSLKPAALATWTMDSLEQLLSKSVNHPQSKAYVQEIVVNSRPSLDVDLGAALQSFKERTIDQTGFLKEFGHRSGQEMELSQPRWIEDPRALNHHRFQEARKTPLRPTLVEEAIAEEAKLSPRAMKQLNGLVFKLKRYLGLRETGKHHFLLGYAIIRRILVELGRRHQVGDGVFFLVPEELPRLVAGEDLTQVIRDRRRRRALALNLDVPAVLFSDNLEVIGRPISANGDNQYQGVPLAPGVWEGPAWVARDHHEPCPLDSPFILVCSATDPGWLALVTLARGLVVETAGLLSHAAILARELGLPAVGGIPGIAHKLRTGQRIRIDGSAGTVSISQTS